MAHPAAAATAGFGKKLASAARRFLSALGARTGVRATRQDALLEEMPTCLEFAATLAVRKPSGKPAAALLSRLAGRLETPTGSRLLLAWLLLRGRKVQLDEFGLDYSLIQAGGRGSLYENRHDVQLLQALLAWNEVGSAPEGSIALARAFETADCRAFMLVHESGGTEWFNKERYEELLKWFSIIALMQCAARKPAPRSVSALLGRLADENRRLAEMAMHAGYRSTLLVLLLQQAASRPAVTVNAPATISKTRKKTDVQGSAGTHTPKTPDHKVPR
jgi:hypothetical protein